MTDMIAGKLMPQPVSVLSTVLSITFIGRGRKFNPAVLDIFRVRRDNVAEALLWLKENNPKYYGNINIDSSRLNELPVNDVPDEIKINMRQEEYPAFITTESEGYVSGNNIYEEAGDISSLPLEDEHTCDNPDVVPLQYLGAMDNEGTKITSRDILECGLANLLKQSSNSEMYAIRYGAPTNTFGQPRHGELADPGRGNYWERAFPMLYPYGIGGIESDRPVKLSFIEHIRWSLLHCDRRFRQHETFVFSAFSIQQRRQALMSAKLLTQRKDFPTVERIMREISLQELQKAAEEECMGLKPSNPSIRLLEGKATAVAKRVIGSNAARAQLRSQIISTSLLLNQPALWLTINPDDYNDPIAQIYAGAEIDMDNFSLTSAPSPTKRAQNIAGDPFAAAQFFNFTIKTILEKLFGIVATTTRVHSSMGVLGRVQAYFGTVECQGRGTLHLHMLLWLEGSPPPCEMKERLQTEEFRLKMATYLQANVRTYLSELHSPEHLKKIPVNPHVAYSRLPNPSKPPDQLYAELRQLEVAVARSKQMHKCDDSVCKRYDKYGHEYCKRRAPWELSEHDTVCSDGTYRTRRTLGYLNGYCPWIAVATKSNHDIKFCSYGSKATGIAFYCTKYMVKGEGRSHNTSSLLAKGLVYYYEETPRNTQLQNNRDDLIWKAFNILNREQEVPAPLVVTHLMGWGDVYKSHQYATIFWMSFVSVIHKFYPQLRWNREESGNTDPPKDSSGPSAENIDSEHLGERNTSRMVHDEEETIVLQFDKVGRARPSSQVDDYIYRSRETDNYSLLDYFVGTYETKILPMRENTLPERQPQLGQENQLLGETQAIFSVSNNPRSNGRPVHHRICYMELHPCWDTHHRIIRPPQHNTLPNIIGPAFPRSSDPDQSDRYAAWVLTLLKPWRTMGDLKAIDQSWNEALTAFLKFCDQRTRNVIDNIEHYHVCKTAAEGGQEAANIVEESQLIDEDIDMEMDEMLDNNTTYSSSMITAEMVAEEKSKALNNREMAHGLQAVRIGEAKHIFRTSKMNVIQQRANKGSSEDIEALKEWKLLLDRAKKLPLASAMENTSSSVVGGRGNADIMPIELIGSIVPLQLPRVEAIQGPLQEQSLPSLGMDKLLSDQKRAFEIVRWHLSQHLVAADQPYKKQPGQLLMLLTGAGGTGKSRVIQTITNEFKRRGCEEKLLKSAYTGIAASLIDGKTTHHIASISVGDSKKVLSVDAKKKLGILWKEVDYLVVDECSMLSKPFLAQLSRNIATAKMEFNQAVGHLPFGGVNIILCGDLHQFPPVAGASKCALYHPVDLKRDQTNTDSQYGRATYEKFETVVALKEQVRVTDPVWQAFLDRLRHGRVKDEDVAMLKELTLTNTQCCPTDFSSPKWENCCLITPRHAVRNQWNYAAVTQHCQNSAAQLYISPANDTVSGKKGRRPLALHEQFVAAKSKCDSRGIGAKNGLPDEVLLAIGLKVMVTLNIETDLDIANGARGTICDIVLSPSEPPIDPDEPVVTLREPPAYILVQLDRTRALELPGLQKGVVPIVPATKSYRISIPVLQPTGEVKVISRTVRRQQLPITPAYAFTDYRSQGQTIPAAIVDIATPPTGSGLTLANIYVALSRSSGSDSIRILREFDESIFMKPVDYDLVKEDERLELLDQQTMNWWESLNGNK
ncbi:DNA repair and recombination protein pif1, mitochondrial OS=Schizosaccharomyces pombe (strain 972 / ATCC 24843) GN=pif1 PE=1 SV=1 [Rhizoctonia solani AG-1 IB]|uniref:ATP-dependent DNA helicase n=1 Tax=Thanatephorus cucumeris (strain AG1-IB / isolate 7/3/14) TaxID=1108050 RepID=A0A0B7FZK2_THACB|nr:DNA repair and recombination protein pif1, mitochondrial OS=Schizosaccharomyces pombe (strain 972 / ATCC 24843) GN=pif1 PE=1 SV=1 [Rhizoctonia solani AG-1 IB]